MSKANDEFLQQMAQALGASATPGSTPTPAVPKLQQVEPRPTTKDKVEVTFVLYKTVEVVLDGETSEMTTDQIYEAALQELKLQEGGDTFSVSVHELEHSDWDFLENTTEEAQEAWDQQYGDDYDEDGTLLESEDEDEDSDLDDDDSYYGGDDNDDEDAF